MVRVTGEVGARFRFLRFVAATDSAKEFVELFGGKRGHEKVRCVRPDKIVPILKRRRRTKAAA